jgi:hypothetical protein
LPGQPLICCPPYARDRRWSSFTVLPTAQRGRAFIRDVWNAIRSHDAHNTAAPAVKRQRISSQPTRTSDATDHPRRRARHSIRYFWLRAGTGTRAEGSRGGSCMKLFYYSACYSAADTGPEAATRAPSTRTPTRSPTGFGRRESSPAPRTTTCNSASTSFRTRPCAPPRTPVQPIDVPAHDLRGGRCARSVGPCRA